MYQTSNQLTELFDWDTSLNPKRKGTSFMTVPVEHCVLRLIKKILLIILSFLVLQGLSFLM